MFVTSEAVILGPPSVCHRRDSALVSPIDGLFDLF